MATDEVKITFDGLGPHTPTHDSKLLNFFLYLKLYYDNYSRDASELWHDIWLLYSPQKWSRLRKVSSD
jgi:hypothetical protein